MDSNFGGTIIFNLSEVAPFLSKETRDFVISVTETKFVSAKQIAKFEPKFAEQIGKALLTKMGYHAFAS